MIGRVEMIWKSRFSGRFQLVVDLHDSAAILLLGIRHRQENED